MKIEYTLFCKRYDSILNTNMEEKALFKEFAKVSSKAWKQKIQFDLKGADYNDTLLWESPEGIKTKPFYHADDLENIETNQFFGNTEWAIGQEIFAQDAIKANKKALKALSQGVESLSFIVPSKDIDLKDLLQGIDLQTVPIHFNLQFLSATPLKKLFDTIDLTNSDIYLNLDIIGNLARTGNWFINKERDHEILDEILTSNWSNQAKSSLSIDVSLYQNAGANKVQQLAYTLAHANEYLTHYHNLGHDLKHFQKITFKLAIGPNYFFEIAKIRALRLLWKTVAEAYGVVSDCHIITVPSKRNKTLYDYNVNMLRTTTESMAAILGGANTVQNTAYDALYHKTNDFGERLAKNQLLIMKHESYLNKVNNPVDGTYYIERLTDQLAEKALALFKNLEANGGFLRQLKDHTIQKKIKESAQKEQELFNIKKEVLVGTNKYLNPDDKMGNSLELYPFMKTKKRKTLIEPILEKRLAEDIEQKRLKDE